MFVLMPFALAAVATSPPPPPAARPRATPEYRAPAANDLYSLRARKRLASYLRLRLLELRLQQLRRIEQVIRKQLPLDALFH